MYRLHRRQTISGGRHGDNALVVRHVCVSRLDKKWLCAPMTIRFHTCGGRKWEMCMWACMCSFLFNHWSKPDIVIKYLYQSWAELWGTMGVIDCEYTALSISITAKVALQSVKNDLSIPSHKWKHIQAWLPSPFSLVDMANRRLYSVWQPKTTASFAQQQTLSSTSVIRFSA